MNGQIWRVYAWGVVATALAATSISGLMQTWVWWPPAIVTALFVHAAVAGVRYTKVPAALAPLGGVIALLISISVAASDGIAGLIPTPAALNRIISVGRNGTNDIQAFSLPVPATQGIELIIIATVGVVALFVASCCMTPRHAAVAGVPLLALFTGVTVIAPDRTPWLAFLAGGLGYLGLVLSAHRQTVSAWGQAVGRREDASAPFALRWPGRVTALCAVLAALALNAVIPGASGQGWLAGWNADDAFGPRGRAVKAIHPMTQLQGQLARPQPIELLRVRTNDKSPLYLRVASLDTFTRQGWTQSELRAGVDERVANGVENRYLSSQVPTQRTRTEVEIRAFTDSPYLPIYQNVTNVDVRGDWRWDNDSETIFSTRTRTKGLAYTFQSQRVRYTPQLLSQLGWSNYPSTVRGLASDYAQLPDEVPETLRTLTDSFTDGADSRYDAVLAIENHFSPSNGFTYSEQTAAGSSGDALIDFLNNKQGYCEQYASAMAYLVRAAGIPARVAVGFGTGQPRDGYTSVMSRDAHAWVEVLFPSVGWVPFDPTPAGGAGRGALPWSQPAQSGPTPATEQPAEEQPPPPNEQIGDDRTAQSGQLPPPEVIFARDSHTGTLGWVLIGLAGAGLVLSTPGFIRTARRHRRMNAIQNGTHASTMAWRELVDTAVDLGTAPQPAETPREFEHRLSTSLRSEQAATLAHLRRAWEHTQYSATDPPAPKLPGFTGAGQPTIVTGSTFTTTVSRPTARLGSTTSTTIQHDSSHADVTTPIRGIRKPAISVATAVQPAPQLAESTSAAIDALLDNASRSARFRAYTWPASVLTRRRSARKKSSH